MAELKTRIILRNDTHNNWEAVKSTVVLLKGEVGIEFDPSLEGSYKTRVKIGDGVSTWQNLAYFGEDKASVYQVNCTKGGDHIAAIGTVCSSPIQGDIAVVKELIATDKTQRQYTAYVYNGTAWVAMDGNYSAGNVFLTEDITLAGDYTQVGNLTKTKTGTATFAVKGKSVEAALTEIFSKRIQPQIVTQPATSISGAQSSEDLEIGTSVSKSGTLTSSLSAGAYTAFPNQVATGVTAQTWASEVKYTAGKSGSIITGDTASTPYSYSFQMGTDGDTISVNFGATATYAAGNVAIDNLGSLSDPAVQVPAGSKSKDSTATYTCYRKMFYGTRTTTDDLDSDKIRALVGEKSAAKAGNSLAVSIPVGAKRVVIAVPSTRAVTSIHDRNGLGAEIFSSFTTTTINVEGAEGYTAIAYNVYYLDYANPNDTANYYDVTVV